MKAVSLHLHPVLRGIKPIRFPEFLKFVPPGLLYTDEQQRALALTGTRTQGEQNLVDETAALIAKLEIQWDEFLSSRIPQHAPEFNHFKTHAQWCLDWWAGQFGNWPELSLLVRHMYSLPVSSANCERVFSRIAETNPSNFVEDNFARFVMASWNTAQFQLLESPELDELHETS